MSARDELLAALTAERYGTSLWWSRKLAPPKQRPAEDWLQNVAETLVEHPLMTGIGLSPLLELVVSNV